MAFQEKIVSLGTLDTLLFECPVTLSGSAHGIVFSNITATPQPITFKHYCKSSGITQTLAQGRVVPANGEIAWPKPINLAAGDQLIGVATGLNAVTALSSIYLAAAAPVSAGFMPRGEHSIIATYAINDVVSKGGSSYIAVAPNVNDPPPSSRWMLQAAKGEQGSDGADGVDGVTQTAASLGLGNVDNTSDADKPVSTLQAQAIAAAKSEAISAIPASLPASDVSAWAKAATKPTYTATEVGAASLTSNTFTGQQNEAHGADIASAATINLTTATGNLVDVTGTTTITAITLQDGAARTVRFTGSLTLTHSASLVLPGGASITTAAGDFAIFRGYAAGVVRCVAYTKADGKGVVVSGTPVGSEMLWPTETPPTGYLEENGASLLRAGAYSALFSVIGTMYGATDATHFNIPDSRGMFPRMWSHGSTIDPDRASRTAVAVTGATMAAGDHVGTTQADAFEAHTHGGVMSTTTATAVYSQGFTMGPGVTNSTGGNETRPVNTYRMMIIKY